MGKHSLQKDTPTLRINDEINYFEGRVIYKKSPHQDSVDDFNKIMKIQDAKKFAFNLGLDLIEINSSVTPHILRIGDYTKYIWELKQNKKKQKSNLIETKEIQLSVNIAQNDLETKAKQAIKFLNSGKRVKVVLTMRGRELKRNDESSKSFYFFLNSLGENIKYVQTPKQDGNKLMAIIYQ